MIQTQSNFGGGLNTLLPRHRIPEGSCVDIVDAEVFDGTARPTPAFGGEGGGETYYYEAGSSWVSTGGFADATQEQLIIDAATSNKTSTDYVTNNEVTFNSPLTIDAGFVFTIVLNDTVTVVQTTKGLFNGNSFVEYNKDLYVGRDAYSLNVDSVTVNTGQGTTTLTLAAGEVERIHERDEIAESDAIPAGTKITAVAYANDQVTIDSELSITNFDQIAIDATPIKMVDGKLNTTYPMGLEPPEPEFSFSQIGTNADRSGSHSHFWYSTTSGFYPIPFQYGLSEYQTATGAESALSELTDPSLSATFLRKDAGYTNLPVSIDLDNLDDGQYGLYRTGGTSAIIKRVAVLAVKNNLQVSCTVTNAQLAIGLTNLPFGNIYLKIYSYNGQSYDYNGTVLEVNSSATQTFTFNNTVGSTHDVDILVVGLLNEDVLQRESVITALNVSGNTVTGIGPNNVSTIRFLDFIPPQALIDIQPVTQANLPPRNLTFLTEVNNFFFGTVGRVLFISRYADPNNWPLDGYLTFDNEITALSKRGSDLLVYTTFGMYRVYGSAANSMRKVKIPTVDGIPPGLNRCVVPVGNGVIYVSNNGLMLFDGAQVRNLTKEFIGEFSPPSPSYTRNVAGVVDDQYYLLSPSNDGYVLDLRQGLRLTRSSLRASNLHYRGNTNLLYNESGYLGGGPTTQGFDIDTRSFDGEDRSKQKIFRSLTLVGEDFEGVGSMELLVDEASVQIFSPLPATQLLGRTFRLDAPAFGMEAQVRFRDVKGRLMRVDVEMDLLAEQVLRRWNYIELMYSGTLTISYSIDGVTVIDAYVLPDTAGEVQSAQIFFPPMTEGEIGHLRCEETETNRLLRVSYDTEAL